MIYCIVTTCIYNNCNTRKDQYIKSISKLLNLLNDTNKIKIIIVENNGPRKTYLDDLGCEIFYTNNNSLPTRNKGYKELQDILDCLDHYNINDNDLVVKMTGRYMLDDNSQFITVLKTFNTTNYDCIIKYGWYKDPINYKTRDCITGLIAMKAQYIKEIEKPREDDCVEWKWANVTYKIDDNRIYIIQGKLGINICQGNTDYCNI
jgi:hypothetical protein